MRSMRSIARSRGTVHPFLVHLTCGILILGCVASAHAFCGDYNGRLKGVIGYYSTLDSPTDVALLGNTAFLVYPGSLKALDISDPSAPRALGLIGVDDPRAIAGAGTRVYVADGDQDRLRLIDVSDPTHPAALGEIQTPGPALDVAVSGTFGTARYAYVACSDGGVQVVDVSNPMAPRETGSVPAPALTIADAGGGIVCAGADNFTIIDVSNPAAPAVVASIHVAGSINDIAIAGSHAYLASDVGVLLVVDIATPSAPMVVATVPTAYRVATGVAVENGAVFVSSEEDDPGGWPYSGIQILDVSNPANPVLLGRTSTSWSARRMVVRGGDAYVINRMTPNDPPTWPGLEIIDVTRLTTPPVYGVSGVAGEAVDVGLCGSCAVVACQGGGLTLIDVANPWSPAVIGYVDVGGCNAVATVGALAFVGSSQAGWNYSLKVLDLENPADPRVIGSTSLPANADAVALNGSYAFITSYGAESMYVVDVSDPTKPYLAATYAASYAAVNIKISGSFAYMVSKDAVEIVDISDPLQPRQAALYHENYGGNESKPDVAVVGDRIYYCDIRRGIRVLRFDGSTVTLVRRLDLAGRCLGADVEGTILYVASDRIGVRVFDISDPGAPVLIGSVDTPYEAVGVLAATGDSTPRMLLACDNYGGLQIMPSQCLTSAVDERPPARGADAPEIEVFPNPVRRDMTVRLDLPTSVSGAIALARSSVTIFDAAGRAVRHLAAPAAGRMSTVVWDGTDDRGRPVVGGIYFVSVQRGSDRESRHIVVLR